MCPFTKVPVTFNHEENADAYIDGTIKYREMSHYRYEGKNQEVRIVVPYSKISHLTDLHKATGLSRKVCEEIYDQAAENVLGHKYYHDMRRISFSYKEQEQKPNVFQFLIDSLENNKYVKSII